MVSLCVYFLYLYIFIEITSVNDIIQISARNVSILYLCPLPCTHLKSLVLICHHYLWPLTYFALHPPRPTGNHHSAVCTNESVLFVYLLFFCLYSAYDFCPFLANLFHVVYNTLKSIHIVTNVSISSFSWVSSSPSYICTPHFLYPIVYDDRLGCFHFWLL